MSSAPPIMAAPRIEFGTGTRVRAGVVAACFVAVFYNVLLDLQYTWTHDPNWSHGWIIPLFSIWFVHHNWERIKRVPIRLAWVGLPIMLCGLALYWISLWGVRIGYVRPFSMLICLLGVIIFLCGLPVMRYAWVPWVYLFFAVPLPKRFYLMLTEPLRRLAATAAASVLSLFPDLEIKRIGMTLEYLYDGKFGTLFVDTACSGMRSAMALCAIGVAVTFISDRPRWQRIIMIAACVPIATFCNMIRVAVTCVVHIFVDARYATGTYHTVLGLVIYLLAFGLFCALGWVLSNLFVEETAPPPSAA